MIGIIGAMDMEVNGLKERMQNTEVETIGTIDFYKGTIQGIPCVVARSGVGKVNAAICAQIMALVYRPKAMFYTLLINHENHLIVFHLVSFQIIISKLSPQNRIVHRA